MLPNLNLTLGMPDNYLFPCYMDVVPDKPLFALLFYLSLGFYYKRTNLDFHITLQLSASHNVYDWKSEHKPYKYW